MSFFFFFLRLYSAFKSQNQKQWKSFLSLKVLKLTPPPLGSLSHKNLCCNLSKKKTPSWGAQLFKHLVRTWKTPISDARKQQGKKKSLFVLKTFHEHNFHCRFVSFLLITIGCVCFFFCLEVLQPDLIDWDKPITTPTWEVPYGNTSCMPRDVLLTIGDTIIEVNTRGQWHFESYEVCFFFQSSMSWRSRFFDYLPYRTILNKLYEEDPNMNWIAMPKPTYNDSM